MIDFPYPVKGEVGFSIGSKGYVVGGSNTSGVYYSNLYEYDPVLNTWTQKANFPEDGEGGTQVFVIDSVAYLAGGIRNSNVHGVSSAYAYYATTDTWTAIADYPGTLSSGLGSFADDSFGYIGLGGDGSGDFSTAFYRYNPLNNTWTQLDFFPAKGRYDYAANLNGRGFFGLSETNFTSNTSTYYCLGDFYEYDPANNSWQPVPGIPGPPRAIGTIMNFPNFCVFMGGYNNDNGGFLLNDVSEFTLCGNVIDTVNITINDTNRITINDTLFVQVNDTNHVSITQTDTLIIKADLTGVSALDNSITVKVFPNPARSHLQVYIDNDYTTMKGYVIKITNILSRNVFVSPVNRQQYDIDIDSWGGAGTYALYIVDPQMRVVATKMIIIQ